MIRKAKAIWRGTGRDGGGNLCTDSGVLASTPYSFKTRFENEKGTNPEELIAAAHAGCFTMALAFGLQGAGFTPTELSTEAAVTLESEGQGFRISRSALTLRAKVPNLDETKFASFAKEAEKNCPVSKVLNAEIDRAAHACRHVLHHWHRSGQRVAVCKRPINSHEGSADAGR